MSVPSTPPTSPAPHARPGQTERWKGLGGTSLLHAKQPTWANLSPLSLHPLQNGARGRLTAPVWAKGGHGMESGGCA